MPRKKWLRLPKIPAEIQKVELVQKYDEASNREKLYMVVDFARPMFGWLILLLGVTMMATVGPVSDQILSLKVDGQGVPGFLLGCWNAQGLVCCFAFCAMLGYCLGDWSEATSRYFFSLKGMSLMVISGIISGAGSGCWTLSFKYTSVEQSYLFNSFHPTLIIMCRLLALKPVFIGEGVGLLLGLVGASVTAFTPDTAHENKLFGDACSFCSSISLCFYLIASKKVRSHVPLAAMLTIVCLFSAITQSVMAWAVQDHITLDQHPTHGIFGYMHPTYLRWWTFMLLVTAVGQAGYIGSLKYLNPVVVSICMTMEPVMAIFIQNAINMFLLQDLEWPTRLGALGGLMIVLGSAVVSYISRHHADGQEVDVTEESETIAFVEKPATSPPMGYGGLD